MIEKIYIPTACRVDNQVTYNNLPKELQEKVVFVVQDWERDQYQYDAEYIVLPPEIKIGAKNALSRTRKIIYNIAKDERYAMLDDDLHFKRRNSKYWNGISNMEMSSRVCTEDDVREMFETYDKWLDNGVTFCGCAQQNNPPFSNVSEDNRAMSSCYWINGADWADKIDEMRLDETRVAQDVLLIIGLLSRGFRNRVSNEFIFANQSIASNKETSIHWDQTEFDEVHENHKLIESMYPKYFKILYDENGDRVPGGFRDFGKTSVKWSQSYKDSQVNTLF
jgi:hypothetical protein